MGRTGGVGPKTKTLYAGATLATSILLLGVDGAGLSAQVPTDAAADSTQLAEAPVAPGLPIFFTLGLGFGQRQDGCTLCASPLDDQSFTGHVSVGKYLTKGLGLGLDASVWRRGRPGTPGAPDSTGVATPTTLSNMLGNASVTLSYEVWHIFARAGGGFAWGSQDLEELNDQDEAVVIRASGKGIGYSLGGGFTIPVHPMIAVAFFGNWNAGQYDLTSINGVAERDAKHQFWEVGFGVTLR